MTLDVTFWGTRGSFPAVGADFLRYGGDTSCVVIDGAGGPLIFDAGSGLARYGRTLAGAADADLFLSHAHLDHVMGLVYFDPIWRAQSALRIWLEEATAPQIEAALHRQFGPPFHPVPLAQVPAALAFPRFRHSEAFDPRPGVRVTPIPLPHPGGACGFRIDCDDIAIVYGTDTGALNGRERDAALDWARAADLLILDATFSCAESAAHPDWGHMSWKEAIAFGVEAGAAQVCLFHHGPARTDDELDDIAWEAKGISDRVFLARDGMTVAVDAARRAGMGHASAHR